MYQRGICTIAGIARCFLPTPAIPGPAVPQNLSTDLVEDIRLLRELIPDGWLEKEKGVTSAGSVRNWSILIHGNSAGAAKDHPLIEKTYPTADRAQKY